MKELKISAIVFLFSLGSGSLANGNALVNVHYVVTDMGAFAPTAINDNGQVAGNLAGGSSTLACVWSDGTTTGLGALGPGGASYAYGINQSGQVVGWSVGTAGGYALAFLYSNGTMTPLGVLPGGSTTVAFGINDNGQIVGKGDVGEATHAFLYSNGTMTDLGTFGSNNGFAVGINNSGQVAGECYAGFVFPTWGPAYQAVVDTAGSITDFGPLPGYDSSAVCGINAGGAVAGTASFPGTYGTHAFLYSNGTMTDLGALGGSLSSAAGINASGQVVGSASLTGNLTHDAFVYSNGTMTDLNGLIRPDSGWSIVAANAINDSGWIAATATNSAGQSQAILLTPALPGDANLDGQVDVNDLTVVLANFGQSTGMSWGTGDFIGDGKVDVNDLTIVLTNFGQGSGSGIRAVPEPSCLLLVGIGAAGLLAGASCRRR